MKNPAKRLLYTILITIAFLIVYACTMYFVEQRHNEELIVMRNHSQAESIRGILDQLEKTEEETGAVYANDLNTEVRLKTLALAASIANSKKNASEDSQKTVAEDNKKTAAEDGQKTAAQNSQYTGSRIWEDAMVVRVADGTLDIPEEASDMFPGLTADALLNEYTQTRIMQEKGSESPQEVFLTSGRIAGDWYYVRWTPAADYEAYVKSHVDRQRLLDGIGDYYRGEIVLVSGGTNTADAEKGTILYGTPGTQGFHSISEFGITEEDLGKDYFKFSSDDGNTYICTPMALESGKILVCCESVKEEKIAFTGDILTQVLFASALLAGLLVWCYSVMKLAITAELKGERIKKYSPKAVRRRTAYFCELSVLLVFVVAFLTVTMQYMYQEDKAGNAALNILETQIEEDLQEVSDLEEEDIDRYKTFGKEISGILAEHPGFLAKERLAEIARIISADYLIVFDENGDEIGCSEDFTGFSLGTGANDPSTDFRRILKGVSSIVHEAEKDFITGELHRVVGARYDLPGGQGKYGAILISLPVTAGKEHAGGTDKKQVAYRAVSAGREMILEIDPETQMIVSGSREEYVGASSAGLGIKKEYLLDRHMGFFRIDREWYFGISRLIEGKIFYYLVNNTKMLAIGAMFALLTAALFLVGYIMIAWFALRDYSKKNLKKNAHVSPKARRKKIEIPDESTSIGRYVRQWGDLFPEFKAKRVMQIEIGLFMALLLLIALSDTPLANRSVMNFVIEGNWTRGINIFGVVAAIMVFSIEYLLFFIVKVVFLLLYGVLDAKGETVARLIRSLINYLMIAAAICLALYYLGVDTTTLLASLGLLSLAISLGAKDIVADILSGIGTVFEETFSVGDYVEISGFTGRVIEIGIRSVKLLGAANDIKTINNSSISNVRNLSKRTSFCSVSFMVKATDSLEELEAMLARELPAYKDKIPGIISGPKYGGVSSVEDGKMTIEISAEGREEDRYSIQLGLNRLLQSLYERELIFPIDKTTKVNLKFNEESAPAKVAQVQAPRHRLHD